MKSQSPSDGVASDGLPGDRLPGDRRTLITNILRLIGTASAAALLPGLGRAQEAYPARPIRLVVPYPAGGVVDQMARILGEHMSRTLGQPIVVENKPGANANIGTDMVLRSPADGYTLLMGSPYLATNPSLLTTTKWKTSDFAALGLVGAPPNVFVVANDLPVKTLQEFVAYAKARPGKLNVANPGVGSSNHMGQELFFSITGLEMQNIMYKGQPAVVADIASGLVSFALMTIALAAPQIADGRFRALAISAPRRSPELPDVPTVAEAGYADAMFLPWYGVVAAAGLPAPIVKKLSGAIQAAVRDPDVVKRLEKMGTQLTPAPAAEFDKLLDEEAVRWSRIIKERNLRTEG